MRMGVSAMMTLCRSKDKVLKVPCKFGEFPLIGVYPILVN